MQEKKDDTVKKVREKAQVEKTRVVANKGVLRGRIVYNPNLDSWRCINSKGRTVLSVGSKAAALRAYPDFIVKE